MELSQKENRQSFFQKINTSFNTFWIQYEKMLYHGIFGFPPEHDSDEETYDDDFDTLDDDLLPPEPEPNPLFFNSQRGLLHEPCEDASEDSESEDEEESSFCRDECSCKLCFYFKNIIELASQHLYKKRTKNS